MKEKEYIIKELHKIAVGFKNLKKEKEICKATVDAAESLLDFAICNVILVKEDQLIPVASSSKFKQEKISISQKSIAARTYNEGRSIIIDDIQNSFEAVSIKNIYKSGISIPIGSYGVFQAAAYQRNYFSEDYLELAEILISHVTASLDIIYAQEKIKVQKSYFEQLFNNSTEAIVLLDNKHQVIKVNKKFESLFGFKQSELLNKNIDDFILPEELVKRGEEYTRQVKRGEKVEGESIRKTKSGDKINVHLQGFPINLENGQIGIYGLYRDITERKKREKQIEYLSFHDELTGLYNRRYFETELKRLNSSRQHPLTIVIGDLDGLKIINDTYGHKRGDKYLVNTAKILKLTARTEDIIARIGGDEFAMILPETNYSEAKSFCQRLKKNIKEFNQNQELEKPLSISFGFEVMINGSSNLEKIFNKADQNMYLNKGRR